MIHKGVEAPAVKPIQFLAFTPNFSRNSTA
jgi:hypothetical protein